AKWPQLLRVSLFEASRKLGSVFIERLLANQKLSHIASLIISPDRLTKSRAKVARASTIILAQNRQYVAGAGASDRPWRRTLDAEAICSISCAKPAG
ncbi:hypothetical protein, partial [Rhizobium laguerreae]|uniref:hypothetical protein n=1 Tax=Rhizobium laguerreae TaxID=1076926 RepID=UPI00197FD7DE